MSVFQLATANRSSVLAHNYHQAASQVNVVCGPEFVNASLAAAKYHQRQWTADKSSKPVAPSKRPITERPIQNNRDKSEIVNAFLPMQLAEIIAIRQRREHAWHARILICTTMISSIDSTLVNFKEEIEMEEIVAFKAFLRQAIANFAAADSSPSPPLIPSNTRPNKGNGNSSSKEKNTKKTLVATPRIVPTPVSNRRKTQELALPKTPSTNDKTWVTVASNGHKKARVVVCDKTQ
ncbi:hypothetical protein EPUL_005052, partial [Erysiphe pulchra]